MANEVPGVCGRFWFFESIEETPDVHLPTSENALHTKYFPKDLVSTIELRRALNAVTMKKEVDPAMLFEQISAIENKFNTVNYRIPKEDRIATVLEKAPREYGTVLTVEQRSKGNNLTLEDLYDAMSQLWRTLYRDDIEVGDGAEIGLTSTESQLTCYRCKKRGIKHFNVLTSKRVVVRTTRTEERSSRENATDVANKVTDKKIVGKTTETQIKDPRTIEKSNGQQC
jgi:hypothetical protein